LIFMAPFLYYIIDTGVYDAYYISLMAKPKAIALYSGGLDSTLAILVMMRHGIEVEALKFTMHFCGDAADSSSRGSDPYKAAEQFGFSVKLCHLGWKFVEIVKNPPHGYGKNMNPCILIENESGLEGRLVRPLSGKHLPPTVPEKVGLIKRDWLLDIHSRSRKRQMELANQFGLKGYASPASGCLLTDKHYSKRLKDLLKHKEDFDYNDLNLLKVGRQFRLSEKCKLIVGRNEGENEKILSLKNDDDIILEALNTGSPISLLRGKAEKHDIELAAAITARYSDDKYEDSVTVDILQGSRNSKLEIKPVDDGVIDRIRL